MKHHFCLTHDECLGLIQEIRLKSEQLKKYLDTVAGQCACCGNSMYVDDRYYVMTTGEVVHGVCMDRFIQSEASAAAGFPARKIILPGTFEQEHLNISTNHRCVNAGKEETHERQRANRLYHTV